MYSYSWVFFYLYSAFSNVHILMLHQLVYLCPYWWKCTQPQVWIERIGSSTQWTPLNRITNNWISHLVDGWDGIIPYSRCVKMAGMESFPIPAVLKWLDGIIPYSFYVKMAGMESFHIPAVLKWMGWNHSLFLLCKNDGWNHSVFLLC